MAADKPRLIIFDTTLRDGEQSPGAAMTAADKFRIAEQLAELGVDVIEAGFPAASDGDFAAVKHIAENIKGPTICGLSRAKETDIRRAWEAVQAADKPRIHTFLATSPLHREFKLQMDKAQILEAIRDSVTLAHKLSPDVEWSAEDATRTERDFLFRCVETAIKAGAQTINIPDTVGFTLPEEYTALIRDLRTQVPGADRVIFSVHCHNDLGLATANSIAGTLGGAQQIECTINGIGERAGNAALEEIVMAIKTRGDLSPVSADHIRTTHLTRVSKMVANISGMQVQPHKPIVGPNAFAHESGIHQDGYLKHRGTYEIMTPESVGVQKASLPLGKLSGRNAFKTKLDALGYHLGDNALNEAFTRFKELADRKRHIFDEDLIALVDEEVASLADRIKFVSLSVVAGSTGPQSADLILNIDGAMHHQHATGNGPVDAIFNAIQGLVPHAGAQLELYQINAITAGTDAQGQVTVRLAQNGQTYTGTGADTDVLVASAKAYLHALNKLTALQVH